ncbi:hypothetical protein [Methanogenium organophilum]|uniref:Uncharacterized protein n=1 Tax=Methanogenium organophilum TaxID=2199 RepID=A0A9X9S5T2_METOG|nr:hypothetical protein [Methanogenium organophilum]WAI02002.1 hypothetical protein OU421_03790 [Methanogenium organophilum]
MKDRETHPKAAGGNAAFIGILVCVVICGVMAAGCSSFSTKGNISSLEEGIVITTGDGNIGPNFASYPVTIKNTAIFSVKDVRLQADLLDITGGGETVLSSQEIDAGSFAPGESRTVDVEFRLIRLIGKDVELRVTRVG